VVISSRRALLFLLASAWARPAFAHRPQSVLTTLEWNARTRMLEAIHRIHGHDAEVALGLIASSASERDLSTPRGQARLALYVEQRFAVRAAGSGLSVSTVGAELSGEEVLLYQEAPLPEPYDQIDVDNRILRDVFDGQTNLVNVRMERRTRTLVFSGRDGPKTARDLL